ncbi:MAG: hypothetical protein J3K34DRAFT_406850 [Monoraphidium minutum]|nr:MAG: hypothetical protein J3K34DRAFT_406850 [Monoraphidium minutum]
MVTRAGALPRQRPGARKQAHTCFVERSSRAPVHRRDSNAVARNGGAQLSVKGCRPNREGAGHLGRRARALPHDPPGIGVEGSSWDREALQVGKCGWALGRGVTGMGVWGGASCSGKQLVAVLRRQRCARFGGCGVAAPRPARRRGRYGRGCAGRARRRRARCAGLARPGPAR